MQKLSQIASNQPYTTTGERGAKIVTSTFLLFILTCSLLMSVSCNNTASDNVENQSDTLADKAQNVMADAKEEINEYRDESFIKNIVEKNYEELHLLSLGMKKATNKDVRQAAIKMHSDHEKLAILLTAYSTKKSIEVNVDENITDALDTKEAGAEWDKDWLDKLADEHEKIINKFEDADSRTTDNELKAITSDNLPVLRSHYEKVKELQNRVNNK